MKAIHTAFEPPRCMQLVAMVPQSKEVGMISKGGSRGKKAVAPELKSILKQDYLRVFESLPSFPYKRYADCF